MEDEGCGARVCLELGAAIPGEGEQEGEGEGEGEGGRPGVSAMHVDVDMDGLCEGMRALPAPSRIHFGRRREAGESLRNDGFGKRALGLRLLMAWRGALSAGEQVRGTEA
jgi:hypothetical protein